MDAREEYDSPEYMPENQSTSVSDELDISVEVEQDEEFTMDVEVDSTSQEEMVSEEIEKSPIIETEFTAHEEDFVVEQSHEVKDQERDSGYELGI